VIPGKPYRTYSFVEDHPELGNVCFVWLYDLGDNPVPHPEQPEQLSFI